MLPVIAGVAARVAVRQLLRDITKAMRELARDVIKTGKSFPKLTIKHNFPEVIRELDKLHNDIRNKALPSALNKTIEQARTAMSREIRAEFVMSMAEVSSSLRITRARASGGANNMQATVEAIRKRGGSQNLIRFIERSTTMAQARKRGKAGTLNQLHVQVKRNGHKVPMGSAFIGNKGRTMFVREGKGRLPIKALQTVDVASMFNTKRVNDKVVAMMKERFPIILEREMKYFTDKFNASKAA